VSRSLDLLDRLRNLLLVCIGSRIVYMNPGGPAILGLSSPTAVIGQSFFSFVHHDYAELADLGLDVFAEESSLVLMKLVRIDGSHIDVDLSVSRLDASGEGVFLVEAHDITDHLKAARALRAREQRLEGIINTVADGIITLDDNGVIQTFNPAAEAIFGFSKEEVIGRNIRSLITDAQQGGGEDNRAHVLLSGSNFTGRRKDGDVVPLEVAVRELQQGEELSFTSIVRDISRRKAEEARVFHMAHYDALTELPNRHLFDDHVREAFKRAQRHGEKLALLFVDLDKFKPINDTYGHAMGDEVLKEIACRLRAGVRATDTVARVGGDEFLVLLEELSCPAEAEEVRQKLLRLVSAPLAIARVRLAIGASIGLAVYPDHAAEIADLMEFADRDMYSHKNYRAQ
jgi:diguanylate cyclase (GGDEF)-like protein/PAS domain S-box-containing protein